MFGYYFRLLGSDLNFFKTRIKLIRVNSDYIQIGSNISLREIYVKYSKYARLQFNRKKIKYANNKIAIIGASGFLGSYLYFSLLRNFTVVGTYFSKPKNGLYFLE